MRLRLIFNSQFPEINRKGLAKVIKDICKQQGFSKDAEMSVNIVGDQEMKKLNHRYMKQLGVTDVLSFPLDKETGPDGIIRLGDVVICSPQAKRQAKRKGIKVNEEVENLIEHGVLHLLGIHYR